MMIESTGHGTKISLRMIYLTKVFFFFSGFSVLLRLVEGYPCDEIQMIKKGHDHDITR
jgi:hypothetical protein